MGVQHRRGETFSTGKKFEKVLGVKHLEGLFSGEKIMGRSLHFMKSHFPFKLDRKPSEKGFSKCGLVHKKSASAKL
jgi:hypothetical protein